MNNDQVQCSAQLQWSQSQLALLQQCKGNLEQTEQGVIRLAAQACNVAALKLEINSLRNKLSEFDSGLFIVTTIGMLKAGKSTLVNLLARSCLASPTGFGFDTTLRPALITQADNGSGCIQIWFKSDGDKGSVENSLDEVFAVIRGTLDKTTKAHAAEYPLNDENLRNALCKKQQEAKGNMLPKEPLLVVVKVPPAANALLSEKIAILDTPGLDSGISEWSQDKDNCYRWILRRSDLILFLQSSVAPLNETAAAILKEIQKSDRSAPIWLVHNVMEAKHWLKKENIEQESEEQQEMANAIFQKAVGRDFSSFQANLGKAHSSILKSEQVSEMQVHSLLQESNFESLELSIKASLNSSSGKIRKENCCKQALESINNINNAWTILLDELQTKRSDLKNKKDDIRSMLSTFREGKSKRKITESFQQFSRDKIVIKCQKWRDLENWQRILIDKINDKVKIEEKYTAAEENEIVATIANELASGISEMVQEVGEGDISLNTAGDGKAAADITSKLLEIFDDYVRNIASRNSSSNLENFIQKRQWVLSNFRDNMELGLPAGLSNLKEKKNEKTLLIFDKKFDGQSVRGSVKTSLWGPLEVFFKDCETKLNEAVLRWINETALSDLAAIFEKELECEVEEKSKELDEKLNSLEKIINDAEKLKEANCLKMKELLERISQENE